MASARPEDYFLRVTAGASYGRASHVEVPVNAMEPARVRGAAADVDVCVRIRGYERGLPRDAPVSSVYFSAEPHVTTGDTYSIALRFRAAPDGAPISGHDLQWGNDLDRPVRDHLPPGFNQALRILRWWIDPGLVGDAYADRPHLYGPALSSFNIVRVGMMPDQPSFLYITEGGDEQGLATRAALGCPADAAARQKWALTDEAKSRWTWEPGRVYGLDFYNGYIDFSQFAIKLPGLQLPVLPYWDGQSLRYVLRNRATEQVYLVVEFSLVRREDVEEEERKAAEEAKAENKFRETAENTSKVSVESKNTEIS